MAPVIRHNSMVFGPQASSVSMLLPGSTSSPGPPPEYSPPATSTPPSNENVIVDVVIESPSTTETSCANPTTSTTTTNTTTMTTSTSSINRSRRHHHSSSTSSSSHRHRHRYSRDFPQLSRLVPSSGSTNHHHRSSSRTHCSSDHNNQQSSSQTTPAPSTNFSNYYQRLFQHFYSPTSRAAGSNYHRSNSSIEKSPFLIVKILLFSLMTIDFVMNTIGLAVIIVIVKNHYNNFIVERSFIIRSEEFAGSSGGAFGTGNHHIHHQPYSHHQIAAMTNSVPILSFSSNDGQIKQPPPPLTSSNSGPLPQSEWSLLLPLLPSFIFAEILTLIGMFGVFCDLFSFTMTYAILKLITSLCYPSMASMAAVAAMAAATASTTPHSTTTIPAVNINSTTTTSGLVPTILPFNFNDHPSTTVKKERPSIQSAHVFYDEPPSLNHRQSQSYTTIPPLRLTSMPSTTTMPSAIIMLNDSITPTPMIPPLITDDTPGGSTNISNVPNNSNSSSPFKNDEDDDIEFESSAASSSSSTMTTNQPITTATTAKQSNYHQQVKNSVGWLKNYEISNQNSNNPNKEKDLRQMKKSDRLAKLKLREKQLRTKLMLKLETLDNNHSMDGSNSSGNRFRSNQWIFDSLPLQQQTSTSSHHQKPPQPFRLSSVLLQQPQANILDSTSGQQSTNQQQQTHNIKYHHRVWDALLVTFEVIFAVAFAFNLLSNKRNGEDHIPEHRHHPTDEDSPTTSGWWFGDFVDLDDGEGGELFGTLGRNNHYFHRSTARMTTRTARGTRSRHHRGPYLAGHHHYWPYSPLATSIDAFYFAYFRLPPPPPPYFIHCHRTAINNSQQTNNNRQSNETTSTTNANTTTATDSSGTRRRRNHHHRQYRHLLTARALFDGSVVNLRRLTPSWLLMENNRNGANQPHSQQPTQSANENETTNDSSEPRRRRSQRRIIVGGIEYCPPPQYEDIERDHLVNLVIEEPPPVSTGQQSETVNNQLEEQASRSERIVLQIINSQQTDHDQEQSSISLPSIIEVIDGDQQPSTNDNEIIVEYVEPPVEDDDKESPELPNNNKEDDHNENNGQQTNQTTTTISDTQV